LKDFLHAKSPLEKYNDDKELKKRTRFYDISNFNKNKWNDFL